MNARDLEAEGLDWAGVRLFQVQSGNCFHFQGVRGGGGGGRGLITKGRVKDWEGINCFGSPTLSKLTPSTKPGSPNTYYLIVAPFARGR